MDWERLRDNRGLAVMLMMLLLVSSVLIFPHFFMAAEPPLFLLISITSIPIFVFFYSLFLAIFVW